MCALTELNTIEPLVGAKKSAIDVEERATSKRSVLGATGLVILLVGAVGALMWEAQEELRTGQHTRVHELRLYLGRMLTKMLSCCR